ncbi:hypothetical protein P8452_59549 [Trifolium repens]|nr:hypothetical protein P8452_59549 [Trifolium repens]
MFSFLLIACSIQCSVANYCVLGTLPIVLGDKPEDLKSFDEVLNIRGLCVLIWIKECKYPVCIACYFDLMSLYGLFLVSIRSLVEAEQLPYIDILGFKAISKRWS